MGITWQRGRGWGRLPSLVTVLVLVALLCIVWSVPVFAQITWESYRESARSTVWGTVANPYDATYNVVYMGGSGFIKNQTYNIGYYDGNGNRVATDANKKATGGNLKSEYALTTDPNAAPGTWHSSVYQTPTSPPATYDGSGVANDDFQVDAGAVPEIPTVMASIVVAGACFGIYIFMRKKLAHARA